MEHGHGANAHEPGPPAYPSSPYGTHPRPGDTEAPRDHGQQQQQQQPLIVAPEASVCALEPADGVDAAQPAGEGGSSSPSGGAPPPAKRPRLGLPRYAPVLATGAPASAAAPAAAGPGGQRAAAGCGAAAAAAAAAQASPAQATSSSDVVELLDSSAPSTAGGGGDGIGAGASGGRGCDSTAALHPFFTRQGAAGGKPQSPSASRKGGGGGAKGGTGRGGGGAGGRGTGRASGTGGPGPASAAGAAAASASGEAAVAHVKQEAPESGPSCVAHGGDTHLGGQRGHQMMVATLQPAPAAPSSTSPATAAAAAAAAAPAAADSAPAMSWEACREALLLPLESYDPLRHACWGPAHCSGAAAPAAAPAPAATPAADAADAAADGRGPTPYLHVALCLSALSSTTKRLAISDALTNMFRSVLAAADDPGRDLVAALYLVTGRIAPEYDKTELNVGGATVSGALQAATGASAARLKQLYRDRGDLGDVAAACRRTQSTLRSPEPLLCGRLLAALRVLAADKGQGVAARRQKVVLGLLRACRDVELRFLVRTLISNLRVGANWRSVLAPLGRAVLLHQRSAAGAAGVRAAAVAAAPSPATVKGARGGGGGKAAAARQRGAAAAAALGCSKAELEAAGAAVLEAYHTCPNFEILVPVLLEHGIEGLRTRCGLTLGVPLKPMLANACAGVADGLLQLQSASPAAVAAAAAGAAGGSGASASAPSSAAAGVPATLSLSPSPLVLPPFLVEYKYDGRRAQIHLLPDGRVAIFSRNCEDVTDAHPDVCAMVRQAAAGPAAAGGTAAADAEVATAGASARVAGLEGPASEAAAGARADNSTTAPFAGAGADAGAAADAAASPAPAPAAACTRSLILDAEVVAVEWLPEEEVRAAAEAAEAEGAPPPPAYRLKAFQELATRARGQVEQHEVTVQVCVFVFDLLEWNGTSLLHRPLRERRSLLPAALPGISPGRVMLATAVELQPLQPLQPAAEGEEDGEEGPAATVLVRMWPAPGEPGARRAEEVASAATALHAAAAAAAAAAPAAAGGGRRRRRAPAAAAAAAAVSSPAKAAAAAAAAAAEARVKPEPGTSAVAAVAEAPAVVDLASDEDDGGSDHRPQHHQHHQHHQDQCPPNEQHVMGASKAVMELLLQSFNTGAEGLMLKRLDGASAYEPSRRSEGWIKVKRDYCEGLRDSVDVVPIGAWYGQGRKVKWFSPFLLAVWDPVREEFQSLCRCMSGFSDVFYTAARERLGATIIPGPKPYYNTGERCSVWFEPTEVWELRGADLTLSPVHRAAPGRLHPERGVGMRFPRFIRTRDDKRPEDATTPDDIVHLYNKQTRKVVAAERGGGGPGTGTGAAAAAATARGARARGGRSRGSEDGSEDGGMTKDVGETALQAHEDEEDEEEGRADQDQHDESD